MKKWIFIAFYTQAFLISGCVMILPSGEPASYSSQSIENLKTSHASKDEVEKTLGIPGETVPGEKRNNDSVWIYWFRSHDIDLAVFSGSTPASTSYGDTSPLYETLSAVFSFDESGKITSVEYIEGKGGCTTNKICVANTSPPPSKYWTYVPKPVFDQDILGYSFSINFYLRTIETLQLNSQVRSGEPGTVELFIRTMDLIKQPTLPWNRDRVIHKSIFLSPYFIREKESGKILQSGLHFLQYSVSRRESFYKMKHIIFVLDGKEKIIAEFSGHAGQYYFLSTDYFETATSEMPVSDLRKIRAAKKIEIRFIGDQQTFVVPSKKNKLDFAFKYIALDRILRALDGDHWYDYLKVKDSLVKWDRANMK